MALAIVGVLLVDFTKKESTGTQCHKELKNVTSFIQSILWLKQFLAT